MRPAPLALLCLAACSGEDLARLEGHAPATAGGSPEVVELRHAVELRADRGELRLWVTRAFRNDGLDALDLDRTLLVPEGAVATHLRTEVGGQWQGAALLDAEDAQDRWAALRLAGDAAPLPLGLLEWSGDGLLRLHYWPLLPGQTATVQYELAAPPRYEGDAWWLDYPHDHEDGAAIPEFVGRLRPGGAEASFEDVLEAPEATAGLADESGEAAPTPPEPTATRVRVARQVDGALQARWGARSFGGPHAAFALELEVPARLAPAPVRPRVVFAVDASWTQGEDGVALQRALISGFLEEAPDAEVEVVVYRRFATRLFGRFVPAADVAGALAALGPAAFAPGNGSNVDAAAAVAAQALGSAPGPARLVLFTDSLHRGSLQPADVSSALAALPPEVIVHVVDDRARWSGAVSEERDDDAPLASSAAAHGGVALTLSGAETGEGRARDVMRGLVRPVRIDALEVEGMALDGVPALLDEGQGLRIVGTAESVPNQLVVRGRVWARAVEQVLPVDGELRARLATLAVGTPHVRDALGDEELRAAATEAGAVSPLTSFLAVPPGAAPSVLGDDGLRSLFATGCGASFSGSFGSVTRCGGFAVVAPLPTEALVRDATAACGAHGAVVEVEHTEDEIVDVAVLEADPAAERCVTEAVWGLRLPPEFHQASRRTRVALP